MHLKRCRKFCPALESQENEEMACELLAEMLKLQWKLMILESYAIYIQLNILCKCYIQYGPIVDNTDNNKFKEAV